MRSEPSSTISSNERANRKSPTSTAGLLPHTAFAVSRPRRSSLEVDDVVVQQRRGVDELDGGGERDVALAAIAAEPGAAEGQHRPQPLAAGRDDMAGELRDQRHRAVHALDDHRLTRSRSAASRRNSGSSDGFAASGP